MAAEAEEMEYWKKKLASEQPAMVEELAKAEAERGVLMASLAAYQRRYEGDLQRMAEGMVR